MSLEYDAYLVFLDARVCTYSDGFHPSAGGKFHVWIDEWLFFLAYPGDYSMWSGERRNTLRLDHCGSGCSRIDVVLVLRLDEKNNNERVSEPTMTTLDGNRRSGPVGHNSEVDAHESYDNSDWWKGEN